MKRPSGGEFSLNAGLSTIDAAGELFADVLGLHGFNEVKFIDHFTARYVDHFDSFSRANNFRNRSRKPGLRVPTPNNP